MTDETIVQELTQVAREVFLDDELTLTRDSWGQDIVGWSSILLVDLILAVQEHFHIKISAEEADRLRSMGDLADLIAAKQA